MTNVKKDLNSCEEFMELVTTAHVLSAAIEITKVDDLSGLSMMILTSNSQDHFDELATVAKNVCKEFCRVSYSSIPHSSSTSSDRVKEYAMESLSLGLFLLEFKDAIREGDGTRVLRCWKYLLIIFRVTGHTNYCLEALNLLTQYYYTLPPRYAEQMLWGRFVNSQGGPGQNISADLHMEHLNRLLKDAMTHLGANKTPQAIVRASKALGVVGDILSKFDNTSRVWVSGKHTRRSEKEDLNKLVVELTELKVFSYECGRTHHTYPSMKCNKLFTSINKQKFQRWMSKNVSAFLKSSTLSR